jgi:hypothetical protein
MPQNYQQIPQEFEKIVYKITYILCSGQCCGSVTLTYGSGSESYSFRSVAFKMPTKNKYFFYVVLAYYFLKVHLHQSSKKLITGAANRKKRRSAVNSELALPRLFG